MKKIIKLFSSLVVISAISVSLVGCNQQIPSGNYNIDQNANQGQEVCQDMCGDGVCQEIVCLAVGCPCAETPESCPEDCAEGIGDLVTDSQSYKNSNYKFQAEKAVEWRIEEYEYDPQKVISGMLHSTYFTEDLDSPSRKIYWAIEVWKLTADNNSIAGDRFGGLQLREENDVTIAGISGQELIYSAPSQIPGGMHNYRLFVVRTSEYAYSIYSDFCLDNKKPGCEQFLSTLKFE